MWGLATWLWLPSLSLKWGTITDLPWGNVRVLASLQLWPFLECPTVDYTLQLFFLLWRLQRSCSPAVTHTTNECFASQLCPVTQSPNRQFRLLIRPYQSCPALLAQSYLQLSHHPKSWAGESGKPHDASGWGFQGGDWKDWLSGTPGSARPSDTCEMVAGFAETSLLKGGRAAMLAWSQATHRQFKRGKSQTSSVLQWMMGTIISCKQFYGCFPLLTSSMVSQQNGPFRHIALLGSQLLLLFVRAVGQPFRQANF